MLFAFFTFVDKIQEKLRLGKEVSIYLKIFPGTRRDTQEDICQCLSEFSLS